MENTNPRPNKYEYNTGGAQYGYEFVTHSDGSDIRSRIFGYPESAEKWVYKAS